MCAWVALLEGDDVVEGVHHYEGRGYTTMCAWVALLEGDDVVEVGRLGGEAGAREAVELDPLLHAALEADDVLARGARGGG